MFLISLQSSENCHQSFNCGNSEMGNAKEEPNFEKKLTLLDNNNDISIY